MLFILQAEKKIHSGIVYKLRDKTCINAIKSCNLFIYINYILIIY